jgi:nucleotide-binding universal stress UspA family protein
MKSIVFPTDFSKCAGNALSYTIGLAEKLNVKIILHNSCHLPAFSEQIPLENMSEEQVIMDASVSMEELVKESRLIEKKIQYETNINFGMATDDIVSVAKEKKADFIVMGTKGATGLEKVMIGSNASSVIEKATCPVITIPDDAKYRELRKIVFAADYNSNDADTISFLATLAKPYDAEILVVHISPITGTDTLERDRFHDFKEMIKTKVPYSRISFQLAVGLNLADDIDFIIDEQKADMLALTNRKRNIFTKLFSPSLTKRMSFHTHIPVISFHVK